MWYLCGSESLSVRCTLPAGDKHVVIVKLGHYITYQLAFLSNSQIRSFRAYSLVSQAYLLVNEPRKTNVCFTAACFSLRLIISQIRNARELVSTPIWLVRGNPVIDAGVKRDLGRRRWRGRFLRWRRRGSWAGRALLWSQRGSGCKAVIFFCGYMLLQLLFRVFWDYSRSLVNETKTWK